jgi:outer membrane protein OmpA-like peptidoglycan-associated protein
VEAPSSEFDQLRDLLLAPEVSSLQTLAGDLDALRQQVHDPDQLSHLVEPVLANIIDRADAPVRLALLKILVPLLARAIRENTVIDATALAAALAPTSTGAIARHYADSPQEASSDLAPLVSAAIKETVRGERDAMIEALYPVIGSTISKYLSETLATLVRQINEKIESQLSVGSVVRKVRSRLTGVSEAELLLRESLPVRVDAAFLIHTASGLVIAQAQNPAIPALDPDLLSGMLTAIRSLFNDSMDTGGKAQELDQISYGESTILLEVAGYCYLAVVVHGLPDDTLRTRLRETMAGIIQRPGFSFDAYSGNTQDVPDVITADVKRLVEDPPVAEQRSGGRAPAGVIWIGMILLLAILIPLGIWMYRNSMDRDTETRIRAALSAAYPTHANSITATVDRGNIRLEGTTPNTFRRSGVEAFVGGVLPDARIENNLTVPPPPPLPVLVSAQVEGMMAALNTLPGVVVDASYQNGALRLSGTAPDPVTAAKIVESFTELTGVETITTAIVPAKAAIGSRILFEHASARLSPVAMSTIDSVGIVLRKALWARLLITGHSDRTGDETVNKKISLARARAVQEILMARGIAGDRIMIEGGGAPPENGMAGLSDSLSRCVIFSLVSPASELTR